MSHLANTMKPMPGRYLWVGTDFPEHFLAAFLRRANPGDLGACWLWDGAVATNGYGLFRSAGLVGNTHRISYASSIGNPPPDLVVRHHCDAPACWNPEHLAIGTQADNSQDAVARNRTCHGDRNALKLNHDVAREIFAAYHGGTSTAMLANRYGLSTCTVHQIAIGNMWSRSTADLRHLARIDKPARMLRGEEHPQAKVGTDVVRTIRARVAAGEPRRRMQDDYGLSKSQVQRIVTGTSWADEPT